MQIGSGLEGRLWTFVGGATGKWAVLRMKAVAGSTLDPVAAVEVLPGEPSPPSAGCAWRLRGVTSHDRYVTRQEKNNLVAIQPALGRPEANHAALIPIRKSAAWWALTQDERRAIVEERSGHVATGLKYLPAVARRLHHSRDLGEPFDFITWFEYAPQHEAAFNELLAALRNTEEWKYVEREVDIRLIKTI
jgi:chlorite dismutase